jgi:uncharacterized membrane protein AbrB (regulator of aidB expression)
MIDFSVIRPQQRTAGAWALVIVVYMLLYMGMTDGLWPTLAHFRHMDWKVPEAMDGIIGSVACPFIAGCIVGGALRRELSSPWPVLIAPLLLIVALGYASDSFYSPWWSEGLARLASGAVQGTFAWVGWFLYTRLSRRKSRAETGGDLRTHSI